MKTIQVKIIKITTVMIALVAIAVYAGEAPCGVDQADHTCKTQGQTITQGTAQEPCPGCYDGQVISLNSVIDKKCGGGTYTNCETGDQDFIGVWEVKYTRDCETEIGVCLTVGAEYFQTTITCQGITALSGTCKK